eukprot:3938712-Rhodomonas_salina.1
MLRSASLRDSHISGVAVRGRASPSRQPKARAAIFTPLLPIASIAPQASASSSPMCPWLFAATNITSAARSTLASRRSDGMSPHHCSVAVGAASTPRAMAGGAGEASRDPSEVRSMTCRASSSPDAPTPSSSAPSCSPSDSDSDEELSFADPNKLRTIG